MIRGLTSVAALTALTLTGCTFAIRPSPNPIVTGDKIPLRVGLLVSDAEAFQASSTAGLCLIGMVHTWRVETGPALKAGAHAAFSQMFSEVNMLTNQDEFEEQDLVLLIQPHVRRFAVSQDLAATMELQCELKDRAGREVYSRSFPASGASQGATGCMLGVMGGQAAITETSNDAFNKAFQALAQDIRSAVDFTPYLKPKGRK